MSKMVDHHVLHQRADNQNIGGLYVIDSFLTTITS